MYRQNNDDIGFNHGFPVLAGLKKYVIYLLNFFHFGYWTALDFYGALRSRTYDRSIAKVYLSPVWCVRH